MHPSCKYPRAIETLKNNVKEFQKEASKALLKRERAHSPQTLHPREGFWHSVSPQCIMWRKSVPPIELSKVEVEANLGGAFHYLAYFTEIWFLGTWIKYYLAHVSIPNQPFNDLVGLTP